MYRKYYSYNDMPVLKESQKKEQCETPVKSDTPAKSCSQNKLLPGLDNDDIILLVVFFILIMDNCEDRLLLLALAFIFFSDYFV